MDTKTEQKLLSHMATQTVHMEYTAERLTKIENQFKGVNVQEVKKETKQNTAFNNRIKGIGIAVTILMGVPSVVYAIVRFMP